MRVDESGRKGEYVLTGSHQPLLGEKVSQSLAGRTALITLLSFSISELRRAKIELGRDELIYREMLKGPDYFKLFRRRRDTIMRTRRIKMGAWLVKDIGHKTKDARRCCLKMSPFFLD